MQGLDLLATSVVTLDGNDRIRFVNSAAEQLFAVSSRRVAGEPVSCLFGSPEPVLNLVSQARQGQFGQKRIDLALQLAYSMTTVDMVVTVVAGEDPSEGVLLEFNEQDTRLRAMRQERIAELADENRGMLRNLAHEVKNPLGGIRGAAQLLEGSLSDPELRECAQIIVKETDRLQSLVDRLMEPHRQSLERVPVNIHEVCEHVRSLLLAEFSPGLEITRDYDISLPPVLGNREQVIQVLLNLGRNAAQALNCNGRIDLTTRIARQVTIGRDLHKLALELHVTDNGPGIPAEIRDRVFLPLVSGRDGGTGLGLTLVQSFMQQHGGSVECDSMPGRTDFRLVFPLPPA